MPGAKDIRAGRAYVELFADGTKLEAGLKNASAKLKAWGASIAAMGAGVSAFGAAIVTPLSAMAIASAKSGSELYELARRTGMSVESLSALSYAASMTGNDLGQAEKAIYRMQKSVAGVKDDVEGTTGSLAHLGMSLADVKGLSPEEQFARIAAAIASIQDPTERGAAAMKVFGRSGAQLIPLLEDFGKLSAQAGAFGFVKSSADVAKAKAMEQALTFLSKAFKSLSDTLGSAIMPYLTDVFTRIGKVLIGVRDWIGQNKELVLTVFQWGIALVGAGAALMILGKAIVMTGAVLSGILGVIHTVQAGFSAMGAVISVMLNPLGLVIAAVAGLGVYLLVSTGAGGKALSWLSDRFNDLRDDALAAFGGISNALMAGDIGLAAKILWLTLKMEWTKGANWLSEIWNSGLVAMKGIFIESMAGLSMIAEVIWHGLEVAWIETTAFLGKCWTDFCTGITQAWNDAAALVAKGINWVKSLWDDSFDADAANKAADAYAQAQNRQVASQGGAANSAREQQRQQERDAAKDIHDRTMDQFVTDAEAAKAKLQEEYNRKLAANQKELDDARRQWQDAIGEAAKKRAAVDAARGPAGELESPEELLARLKGKLGGVGDALSSAAKMSVVGTFNASAAFGLGTGNTADRIAKATEKTADGVRRLNDKPGMAFS